ELGGRRLQLRRLSHLSGLSNLEGDHQRTARPTRKRHQRARTGIGSHAVVGHWSGASVVHVSTRTLTLLPISNHSHCTRAKASHDKLFPYLPRCSSRVALDGVSVLWASFCPLDTRA